MTTQHAPRSSWCRRTALAAVAVILFVLPLRASDPTGIYALVDKVVLEPNDASPERIQVWGAFALAKDENRDDYHSAKRGYLYLTLGPGQKDVCRKEWADLKRVAGTGEPVGFWSRKEAKPRIRAAADKPQGPDTYALGWGGVVKLADRNWAVARDLKSPAR